MIAISEIRLYDILKSKFKLSEADAKEIIAEVAIANERTDRAIDEKVDSRFSSLKETFATKEDIHKIDVKLEQTKVDSIKWMFGFWVTLVLLILANWFLKNSKINKSSAMRSVLASHFYYIASGDCNSYFAK